MGVLIFFAPVVDAFAAEEITASCALLGVADNIGADGAVEHISCEVREEFSVEAEVSHFVESCWQIL